MLSINGTHTGGTLKELSFGELSLSLNVHQLSRVLGGISQTKAQMGISLAEFWEKSVKQKHKWASPKRKLLGGGRRWGRREAL